MAFDRQHALTILAVGVLAAMLLAGCGGSDTDRLSVSGTVTLDGQPLEEGSILFIPRGEGPPTGTTVNNGRFAVRRSDGPVPGLYRVEIRSFRETGRLVPDDDLPGQMTELRQQVIPSRYNDTSDLEVTFPAGKRNHDVAFLLESN